MSDALAKRIIYIGALTFTARQIVDMQFALEEIANEKEIHTKLNQQRLCCKFQDIAMKALPSVNGSDE